MWGEDEFEAAFAFDSRADEEKREYHPGSHVLARALGKSLLFYLKTLHIKVGHFLFFRKFSLV